ncbi:hypothetical protein L1785_14535 [Antribacter sp. KLBMP9083]|uniref:Protein kinase domain-containing protein n=1 Tax=Antribacter soli TaxID=2910976 RepID=A0AA41QEW6_9MICO|nr:hypothetical protein [Antribacter soli]MCF4122194.1 hypothetical protein [Antribacter soli]
MSTPIAPLPSAIVGLQLNDGWRIDSEVVMTAAQTGGNFSLSYKGSDAQGRQGFIKVLNYEYALSTPDPPATMQAMTEAYTFERQLVERCSAGRLSKIVRAYSHGSVYTAAWGFVPVSYIVFELAESDVRKALDLSQSLDLVVKLRLAHNAATGAAQLHGIGVAHQDIKPSNLLVFGSNSPNANDSKLADLGRASDRNVAAWHDSLTIAGDPAYAPPEQLYREAHDSFEKRRLACDIYQVGNLASFILTGVSFNARLHALLHPVHNWHNWQGDYDEVLPYVQAAHATAVQQIEAEIGGPLAGRIASLISNLTDPDIENRGHPESRRRGEPYAMNRIVSEFDLLSRRAELLVKANW